MRLPDKQYAPPHFCASSGIMPVPRKSSNKVPAIIFTTFLAFAQNTMLNFVDFIRKHCNCE